MTRYRMQLCLGGLLGAGLVVVACGKKSEDGPALKAEGTITLDGQSRTAKSCAMSGTSVDSKLALTLDNGEVINFPIHGGDITLGAEKLECSKQGSSGGGSDNYYDGSITLECERLELDLELTCGEKGPSNRVDGDK